MSSHWNQHGENGKTHSDHYCLHYFKYEICIYVLAIFGSITQLAWSGVIIYYLVFVYTEPGKWTLDEELERFAEIFSYMALLALVSSAGLELYLVRAVRQRFLYYIQWWMVYGMLLLLFSILMTVVSGFTLNDYALWVSLAFLYLVFRVPLQMFFIDKFANAEIFHLELHVSTYQANF